MAPDSAALRIGEFARRVGVSPALLRAWERRYGLLQPVRSEGGFRLYTAGDADRVARMQRALEEGLSAAEAARAALGPSPAGDPLAGAVDRLLAAVHAYDEAALQSVVDEALAAFTPERVVEGLVLPALRRVGAEWEHGELEVGQEHFASNLLRERLLGLARLWGRGSGPLAVLACAPGERHDIGLIAFGVLLRSHGWRILLLGADTPFASLAAAAVATRPRLVVVSSVDSALLEAGGPGLRKLARTSRIVLSGPGASETLCARLRIERLNGDLVAAAATVARSRQTRRAKR